MGNLPLLLAEASSWKVIMKGSQGRGVIFYTLQEGAITHTLTFQDDSPYLLHSSLHIWCILHFM